MIFSDRTPWAQAYMSTIWLPDGAYCIDFSCGIFNSIIGHNNQYVGRVMIDAIDSRMVPASYSAKTGIKEKYVDALCEFTGFESVALFASGTEATEAAWRMMQKRVGGDISGFDDGFHGKTMGARALANSSINIDPGMNSDGFYNHSIMAEPYAPLTVEFRTVGDLETQGTGLLILDEIQSGFGRTGKLFGYQHIDGVTPDLVCIGKGMSNGVVPLSGVLGPRDIVDNPAAEPSSTASGYDLGCYVGLAVIDFIKNNNLIDEAALKGKMLQELLSDVQCETQGVGMVAALIFDSKLIADCVVKLAEERGLWLVHTGRNTVKIGPALTIKDSEIRDGIEILRGVVDECNAAARRD